MSEDQLIHLVRETLRLWAREEMAANPDSDVTYYQRYEEMGDQLLENLTAMLSDVEAALSSPFFSWRAGLCLSAG